MNGRAPAQRMRPRREPSIAAVDAREEGPQPLGRDVGLDVGSDPDLRGLEAIVADAVGRPQRADPLRPPHGREQRVRPFFPQRREERGGCDSRASTSPATLNCSSSGLSSSTVIGSPGMDFASGEMSRG